MIDSKGLVLPAVIVLAALLALAMLIFWGDSKTTIKRLGLSLQAESAFEDERSRLMAGELQTFGKQIACAELLIPSSLQRCVLGKQKLELINYRSIFEGADLCRKITALTGKTEFGNQLTNGSARSNRSCSTIKSRMLGNLAAEELVLDQSKAQAVIAVSGYMDLVMLHVASDAVIIAGGDIFIKLLKATRPAIVTVLSSTGKVTVSELLGPIVVAIHTKDSGDEVNNSAIPRLPALTLGINPQFIPSSGHFSYQ